MPSLLLKRIKLNGMIQKPFVLIKNFLFKKQSSRFEKLFSSLCSIKINGKRLSGVAKILILIHENFKFYILETIIT